MNPGSLASKPILLTTSLTVDGSYVNMIHLLSTFGIYTSISACVYTYTYPQMFVEQMNELICLSISFTWSTDTGPGAILGTRDMVQKKTDRSFQLTFQWEK